MLYPINLTLDDEEKILNLAKALSSPVRIDILKLLLFSSMSVKEIALTLKQPISSTALNINLLENAGLLFTGTTCTTTGKTRTCYRSCDAIQITLFDQLLEMRHEHALKIEHNIPIGSFSTYENIVAPCGMVSKEERIGLDDDTSLFFSPRRFEAALIWFSKGFVEYEIPNFIPGSQKITQILISAELSSEAPGINNVWPSDISFYLNDVCIGTWTSPGDFGDVRGIFTPDWWFPNWNQYGLLKMLVINKKGTFIDGLQISDVTIRDFNLDYRSSMKLRMAVNDNAEHVGGLTIFGKSFGNYGQDIKVSINYAPIEE